MSNVLIDGLTIGFMLGWMSCLALTFIHEEYLHRRREREREDERKEMALHDHMRRNGIRGP